MNFLFNNLVEYLKANKSRATDAFEARKEAAFTTMVGEWLGKNPSASKLHIAASQHKALRAAGVTTPMEKQWSDDFGEHDLSLSLQADNRPSTIIEIKFARTAGKDSGEQDQVIQPYFSFLNNLLYSALGQSARNITVPSHVAIAFIGDSIFSASRPDSKNPWQTLVSKAPEDGIDSILFAPSAARLNSGRGSGKSWPDVRDPTSLEQRHLGMVFTGGTGAKLMGIYRRSKSSLRVRFEVQHAKIPANSSYFHIIALEPTSIELEDGEKRIGDLGTILNWLP